MVVVLFKLQMLYVGDLAGSTEIKLAGSATRNNHIFMVGGYTLFDQTHRYDYTGNSWLQLDSMHAERKYQPCVFNFGNYLYATAGGHASMEKLDVTATSGTWVNMRVNLPVNLKYSHCSTLNGNTVILSGGSDSSSTARKDVYKWVLLTNAWTRVADMKTGRYLHCSASDGVRYVYVAAGQYLNSVERYDSQSDTWQYMQSLPMVWSKHQCTYLNGSILKIGGTGAIVYPEHVIVYNIISDTWKYTNPLKEGADRLVIGVMPIQ